MSNIVDIYQMAVAGSEAAFRERPFMAVFGSAHAPLVHTDNDMANMLWAAMLPSTPAIINAVCRAISARIREIPAMPERVLRVIGAAES